MDMAALVISMSTMGGMGALFAIGLAIADAKLHVDEDPRISMILDQLPGANCGGCGYPGCNAFAERIVNGTAQISGCPVNTDDGIKEISSIMGVETVVSEKKYARLLCMGGNIETAKKGEYLGIKTCIAAHLTFGADKLCQYGCLGFGDCVVACPFDSIQIDDNGLPKINEETCTGCGICAEECPRKVLEIHPKSRNLFIFCKNKDDAKYSRTVCIKACTACKACLKGVEEGQIMMENNLAVISYDIYGTVDEVPTKKCLTGAIGLLNSSANNKTV